MIFFTGQSRSCPRLCIGESDEAVIWFARARDVALRVTRAMGPLECDSGPGSDLLAHRARRGSGFLGIGTCTTLPEHIRSCEGHPEGAVCPWSMDDPSIMLATWGRGGRCSKGGEGPVKGLTILPLEAASRAQGGPSWDAGLGWQMVDGLVTWSSLERTGGETAAEAEIMPSARQGR